MLHDHIKVGPFTVTINMSDEEAAASVGEYVADAIDAGPSLLTLEEISAAARQAFRFAARVRRWPGFGEDWR